MKIRILGDSIRLRLSQKEVNLLHTKGVVKECIRFGNTALKALNYSIQKAATDKITANYEPNEIVILVPSLMVDKWAESEMVSLEHFMELDSESSLRILIEKDFKCLKKRVGENEEDLFPNPSEGELKC